MTGRLILNSSFLPLFVLILASCARTGWDAKPDVSIGIGDLCGLVDGAGGASVVDLLAVAELSRGSGGQRSTGRRVWWSPTRKPDHRMRAAQYPSVVVLMFPSSDGYDEMSLGDPGMGPSELVRSLPGPYLHEPPPDLRSRVLEVVFPEMAGTSRYCIVDGKVAFVSTSQAANPDRQCVSVPFVLRPEDSFSFGSSPVGEQQGPERASVDAADGSVSFGPGTAFVWRHYPPNQPAVPIACGRL